MKLNCYYFQSCFGFLSDLLWRRGEVDFMRPLMRLLQHMNAQGLASYLLLRELKGGLYDHFIALRHMSCLSSEEDRKF